MDSLENEKNLCAGWATAHHDISRVYFYGSRVWGKPRPNSDLDVLIVALPGAMMFESERWASELAELLKLDVHLNDYFTADDSLADRIKSEGLQVFARTNTQADFEFEDDLGEFDPHGE